MIDLGSLVANIVVDGAEGIKNLRDFSVEAGQAEGKAFNLKEGLVKLAKGFAIGAVIKKTADAECDDKVLQNQIGVTMYGTMWEDMGVEAVKALSDTNGEFDKTADNLEKIKEIKYDDLGSAFEGIGRQIEVGMIIPIGEKLLPYVNDFANWINEHMPQIQAVFDTVMTAIGDSIEFVKSIFEGFITSNDDANTKVSEVWNTIQETISNVTTAIGDIFSSVVELFQTIWEEWGEEISGYIDMVFNNIKIIIETTLGVIQGIINAITALIKGDWEGVFNALNDIVETIFNGIIDYFNNTIGRFIEAGKKLFNGFKQGVLDKFKEIKKDVKDKISEIWTSIIDKVEDFKNAGKRIFTGLWDGLKDVWNNLSKWVKEKVDWIADKLTFWRDSQVEMDGGDSADGSHRTGLREVPFDGYTAILHKGEAILAQPEANRYRAGQGNTTKTENFIVNIDKIENSNGRSASDFLKEMEFWRKSRSLAVGGV